MMGRLPVTLAIGARLGLGATAATAQARDAVSAPRLAARRWFAEAKFGLFIHWGAYSQLGAGEWVMHNRKIAVADRSEEHTSELQSRPHLVCRLLLEKKKKT